ncbi:MAG: NAD-dependent deacylase [Candidatus Zixiibacteriota bacterium]|nr:MAG: NAD-dependent deacylase [candidate division Zixibacteria bacterium]
MKLEKIDTLKLRPEHLTNVVVLTGSGISAESGIPTFRNADGYWSRYRAEDLATPEAFSESPQVVWEWYLARRHLIARANPSPGHFALVEMARLLPGQFTLITQNVDGMHQRAGHSKLLELHGNIFTNRCAVCARRHSDDTLNFQNLPPACPVCLGPVRPDVVWFGESLNIAVVEDAFTLARNASLFLAIGTSAVVHPAASLPLVASDNGALLIEVNPEATPISDDADIIFRYPAAQVLPSLFRRMRRVVSRNLLVQHV